MMKRDTENGIIGGVCAGMANQFQIDPIWIRLAFLAAFLMWGIGPIIYIILWIIIRK